MTSEMGEDFNAYRAMQKQERRNRLDSFDPTGWTQLSDTHFRRVVGNTRFDYWPSTGTVEWRGKYYRGIHHNTIEGFIRNRTT